MTTINPENNFALLKDAPMVATGFMSVAIIKAVEEKELAEKKSKAEGELLLVKAKVEGAQARFQQLLSNPHRTQSEEQQIMRELYGYQSEAKDIMTAARLKPGDVPAFASVMSMSQSAINQIHQDIKTNLENGKFTTEHEHNGIYYVNKEDRDKVKASDDRIAQSKEKVKAVKKSWKKLGELETKWDWDKDDPADLSMDDLHDELVKAKAIMALRSKMLQSLEEERAVKVAEALLQAEIHGTPAKNIEELQERMSAIPEESRRGEPWLEKLSNLLGDIAKDDADIVAHRSEFRKSAKTYQVLECNRRERDPENAYAVKPAELQVAIRSLGAEAEVSPELIEATARSAAVDTEIKAEKMAIAKEKDAAEVDACKDICLSLKGKCGPIDFENEAYNTPEKFFAALHAESLRTNGAILKDTDVADAYEFLKMTYPEIAEKQPAVAQEKVASKAAASFPEPSAPPTPEEKVANKEAESKTPVSALIKSVPAGLSKEAMAELENIKGNVLEVKQRNMQLPIPPAINAHHSMQQGGISH